MNATRLGKAIRAVAQDADTASLMGINVSMVIVLTFIVGGLLAGCRRLPLCAGLQCQLHMGFLPGIKAFTAAVLGGIGNVRGAMLGGLCARGDRELRG